MLSASIMSKKRTKRFKLQNPRVKTGFSKAFLPPELRVSVTTRF